MAPVPDPNSIEPADSVELHCRVGPQVIELSSGSDSDSDVDIHDGYVPLAQGPEAAQMSDGDSDSSSLGSNDNENAVAGVSTMPAEQAEKIKAMMANVKLANVPLWARQVPEEQWMTTLLSNINRNNAKDTSSSNLPTSSHEPTTALAEKDAAESIDQPFKADFESHFP